LLSPAFSFYFIDAQIMYLSGKFIPDLFNLYHQSNKEANFNLSTQPPLPWLSGIKVDNRLLPL
jgi:hypothetical protein